MALIAVHAVVDIAADVRVMEIVRVPAPMAGSIDARKDRVVVWVEVTGRADTVGIAMIDAPPGVVEGRAGPRCSGVTSGASGGEDRGRGFVDWIRGAVVIRRVTAVASRGERGVVVVYVATGAGNLGVEARQRERGGAVVKFAVGPQRGVMA